jgi:hypothetical protein
MSRSFLTPIRTLALGGVLLVAGRVSAANAQDVTPERALLNTVAGTSSVPIAFFDRAPGLTPRPARPVSGETALLVRVEASPSAESPSGDVPPIDGERALLGRSRPLEARATALSAESE